MSTAGVTYKVLVDEKFIEQAEPNQMYSVPDVSGGVRVGGRLALFHAKNGALVFAIVSNLRDLRDSGKR